MFNYEPIIKTLPLDSDYQLDVLRLDLLHPEVSGNKWFKLKYNIASAILQNKKTIITFGGAFSNHLAATAAYCQLTDLKSIGIIRGEETQELNVTLLKAKTNGMHLHFVNREFYSKKNDAEMELYLLEKFGEHYLIPEGGNNVEGIKGCMEILHPNWDYEYVICACGTATTYAGLVLGAKPHQMVVGISVLKGENKLVSETNELLHKVSPNNKIVIHSNEEVNKDCIATNCIINNYCFSGYAKFDKALYEFKNKFESENAIPLDYIYTNKLFYAVFDLIKNKKFSPKAKLLVVHSGGLQGNQGFETRFGLGKL